jgi:hypothetical protein
MSTVLIRIPRNPPKHERPYWELVRKHGQSRASMVRFITGIGGYSDRSERFAIEFNVAAEGNFTLDHMRDKLVADWNGEQSYMEAPPQEERAAWLSAFAAAHKAGEQSLWERARDSAWEGFECRVGHLWDGSTHKVEVGLRGRGGKHLVLYEVDGYRLTAREEQLALDLMERGGFAFRHGESPFSVDLETVIAIFKVCVQLTVDTRPVNIWNEMEYQVLTYLVMDTELDYEELKDTDALTDQSRLIATHLRNNADWLSADFDLICKRAGLGE